MTKPLPRPPPAFAKSPWEWTDALYAKAETEGKAVSDVLKLGGWDY